MVEITPVPTSSDDDDEPEVPVVIPENISARLRRLLGRHIGQNRLLPGIPFIPSFDTTTVPLENINMDPNQPPPDGTGSNPMFTPGSTSGTGQPAIPSMFRGFGTPPGTPGQPPQQPPPPPGAPPGSPGAGIPPTSPGGGTIPATPFTPAMPGSIDALNQVTASLSTAIYQSNENQSRQIAALTNALDRDLQTRPKPSGPPAPKLPNEKHDLPAVFDRTKMDCAIFIRKFRNYFTLIDDAGTAKLTDAQKIHRMVVRLDIQQTEWHTRFEKQLRRQPDRYLQCNDTDNAYTELTFAEFCQQMTANTEVLTADHTHRLQFKEIRLGKLEDPGCFHLEFQRLTDIIDTMGAKDLFYA